MLAREKVAATTSNRATQEVGGRHGGDHADTSSHASHSQEYSGSSDLSASSSEDDGPLRSNLDTVPLGQRVAIMADGARLPGRRRDIQTQRVENGQLPKPGDPRSDVGQRPSKKAPVVERISHRPVSSLRDPVERRTVHAIDPRFTQAASSSSADVALRRYNFLYKDVVAQELREAKAAAKGAGTPATRRSAAVTADRLQTALHRARELELEAQVRQEWREREKTAQAHGKKPFHLKKSDGRKMVLERKYEKLAAEGKLEKYVAKRRKRVAAKDRKRLPFDTRIGETSV